ncbi:MAG: CPBP family intramembrane metalloprotease [Firmicutes bacterium]|nr:CPBP family intramembrane metalloprotease [Bacillota bacterium]
MKRYIKLLYWPVLFGIGQFLIIGLGLTLFHLGNPIDFENTVSIQTALEAILFPSTFVSLILFGIYFYKKYQKEEIHSFHIKKSDILYYLLFGIVTSFVLNIFFLYIKKLAYGNTISYYQETIYNWFYLGRVISTGLIGPILEELLFRGILYQESKKIMKPMRAILFTTVIFVCFHTTMTSVLTALVTSFLVIHAFEREKSLTGPIIFHIFLNTTSILLIPMITRYPIWILGILLLIFLILFVILYMSKISVNTKGKK